MKIPRIHVRAEAVHNKTVNAELRPLLNLNSMPLAATGACRSDGLGFRVIHNCEVPPPKALYILIATTFAGSASATTVTGSTSFNGKDVAYELAGDSLSVTSSTKNGLCTVEAVVDETKHRINVNSIEMG